VEKPLFGRNYQRNFFPIPGKKPFAKVDYFLMQKAPVSQGVCTFMTLMEIFRSRKMILKRSKVLAKPHFRPFAVQKKHFQILG
jgi:hypothetical protein